MNHIVKPYLIEIQQNGKRSIDSTFNLLVQVDSEERKKLKIRYRVKHVSISCYYLACKI
ncbi:hypothetical protein RhiirB3_456170 [Rhizophagus irregularis]|nr:hypothetical protein RhiirB3_456170 [Rhizophagus irregularis]